jgi:hypothetical protein
VGVVVDFDPHAGLGTVVGSVDGTGPRWLFHCTTIADGSRAIEVGTQVAFVVRAGGPGRWEAFEVTPISL